MIKERKPCQDKQYKQVFVKEINGVRWYTLCQMNEDDYMNISPVWQRLRRKKLQLNPVCEICQSAFNLQIHHVRYPSIWGEEQLEDLMTLCDRCHSEVHRKSGGANIPEECIISRYPEEVPIPFN